MSHDQWLDELRKTHDATTLERLLSQGVPHDGLQHAGDAVLQACRAGPDPELDAAVTALVDALAQRGWDGDAELADALLAVAERQTSTLRPLAVELDELGEALSEADGTENFLDLHNGHVWLHTMTEFGVADDLDVDFEDETRWLVVCGEGSDEAYRDLLRFISSVTDDDLAGRLRDAIDGRGAFGRFRSTLERRDQAEYTRWHRFDADARLGHARSWLASRGYQARPVNHDQPQTDLA